MFFRNCFTPLCVFGTHRKHDQTEIQQPIDRKIMQPKCKVIYALISPLNHFQTPHSKRESSSTLLTRSKTHFQAHLSQAQASPDRAAPIATPPTQIMPHHRLDHVLAKLPLFSLFFLNSSSPSCSTLPIWPPLTISPLHSTPKPT